MKKRILSIILSLAMLLSILPARSVYAEGVEEGTLVYRTLTAETENTSESGNPKKVSVKVSGYLPQNAELNVRPVSLSQDELVKYLGEEKADAINEVTAFDISISSNGKDFEPKDFGESVQVSVNPAMEAENDKIEVAHIEAEEEPAKEVPTFVNASDDLVFSTNSFSTYIFYTVDFHYGDNDECVFSIEGGSSILLSELLAAIGYDKHTAAEITSVEFTNEDLIAVEKLDGDWQLTSLAPFDTDEYLTVKFGEEELKVWVTDAGLGQQSTNDAIRFRHDGAETSWQIFGNLYNSGVSAHYTRWGGKRELKFYLQMPNGTTYSGDNFDNNMRVHPNCSGVEAGVQFAFEGDYWYEVTDWKEMAEPNFLFVDDSSIHNLALGAFGVGDQELYVKAYSRETYNNSNYCKVTQRSVLTRKNGKENRTVKVYADGIYVGEWTGLFPTRTDMDVVDISVSNVASPYIASRTTVRIENGCYRVDLYSAYQVNASVNGGHGTASPTSQTVGYGSNSSSISFTAANGYVIDYIMDNSTKYDVNNTSSTTYIANNVTSNRTVVAYTAPIEYTITYSGLEGATVSGNPSKYNVETATFTLNNPTKTGYTFVGWKEVNENNPQPTVTIVKGSTTGNKSYEAIWLINSHEAKAAIATGDNGIASTSGTNTYNYNQSVTFGATLKPGYDFLGWYDGDSETANRISDNLSFGFTMPDNDVTYYAKTAPIEYTITYVLNDGTNNAANPEKYTIEDTPITLQNPTKLGYTFTGWTEGSSIPQGSTGDKTFTATWNEDKVTYNYEAVCKDTVPDGTNFGSVSPTTEEVGKVTGTPSSTATANAPTFKFVGWFDDAGTALSTNATFEPSNKDSDGLLLGGKFYAVFEYNEAPYKVRHYVQNANDDGYTLKETNEFDLSGNPYIGVIGQLTTKADAHPRTETGYEHYTAVTPIVQQTIAADGSTYVDIYYDLDTYTITYVVPGETDKTATYKVGQTIADYQASKEHYKFSGWFTENTYKNAWEKPATMGAAAITVYGYFSLGSLTVSKSGMSDGETAIFTITGGNLGDPGIRIVVPNGGSVTVKELYVGETYTITEENGWIWRYTADASNKTKSVTETDMNPTVSFTNQKNNNKWLDAFDYIRNLFTGN